MIAIGLREALQIQVSMPMYVSFAEALADLNEEDLINGQYLVDSALIDESELYSFRVTHPGVAIIFIVDVVTYELTELAKAHRFQLLKPEQVVSYLNQNNDENKLPLIAFWGVFPRLGTTSLALSVGRALAEKGKSVIALGMNAYDPGHWMLKNKDRHLGDVLTILQQKNPDREMFRNSLEAVDGIWYLPGFRNPLQALTVEPEQARALIDLAVSMFDQVILDIGSVLNTALALEGMRMAKTRFVVTNDLLSSQQRIFDYLDYVLKPLGVDKASLRLIVNQHHGKLTVSAFSRATGLNPTASIPFVSSMDLYAEGHPDPMKFITNDKWFKKAVDAIAAMDL